MTVADGNTETWVYCRQRQHLIYTTPELVSTNGRITRANVLSEAAWWWGTPQPDGTVPVIPLNQAVPENNCPSPFDGQNYASGVCESSLFKSGNGTSANSSVRFQ